MDPKYQELPTFETTLTDVSELRKKFAARDDNDWPRYKLIVINAVTSGQRLEQRMSNAEVQIENKLARRSAVENLAKDVADLKRAASRRRGATNWVIDHIWVILCIFITAIVTKKCG